MHKISGENRTFSYALVPANALQQIISAALFLAFLTGCSGSFSSIRQEGCKKRTYTDVGFQDYLKSRYDEKQPVRVAIVPFDVQETFSPLGNESGHYGREIATKFLLEFQRAEGAPIVELFNRDRWPGKREEFFTGNYQAIELARNAGYDIVIVGYLEELSGDSEMNLHTKVIDVENNVTLYNAKTMVYSDRRETNRLLSKTGIVNQNPADFAFKERSDELARCTIEGVLGLDKKPQ